MLSPTAHFGSHPAERGSRNSSEEVIKGVCLVDHALHPVVRPTHCSIHLLGSGEVGISHLLQADSDLKVHLFEELGEVIQRVPFAVRRLEINVLRSSSRSSFGGDPSGDSRGPLRQILHEARINLRSNPQSSLLVLLEEVVHLHVGHVAIESHEHVHVAVSVPEVVNLSGGVTEGLSVNFCREVDWVTRNISETIQFPSCFAIVYVHINVDSFAVEFVCSFLDGFHLSVEVSGLGFDLNLDFVLLVFLFYSAFDLVMKLIKIRRDLYGGFANGICHIFSLIQ